jgi:anti-sigma factor RsiW
VANLTFTHVVGALNRRGTSMDSCRVRRFSDAGQGRRGVLEVQRGIFYGLVSCFASGEDFYIGWTYWLCLSPARWLMLWLRRFLWGSSLRHHAVHATLRADGAEALRAALRIVVREGVEVAMGELPAQGEETIGTLVPVVDRQRGPNWKRLFPRSFTSAAGSIPERGFRS